MSDLCSAFGDDTCINTGEVSQKFKKNISTSFLNTCSALGFHVNGYNFLAHIDDMKKNMYKIIIKKLNEIKHELKNIKKIHIWIGDNCNNNCQSLIIAKKVVKYLNKQVEYHKDQDIIIVNKSLV